MELSMTALEETNQKIERIFKIIRDDYPDLLKHLNGRPETSVGEDGAEAAAKYYEELVSIFRNYVAEHQLQNVNRKYTNHHL